MIFRKNPLTPDTQTQWKHLQTQTEKEKRLFLSLCSSSDADLLLGKKPMSVNDFERLYYLIDSLGLEHYSLELALEKGDLMEKLADSMDKKLESRSFCLEKDIKIQETWIHEFLDQLPDEKLKKYIGEIFLL